MVVYGRFYNIIIVTGWTGVCLCLLGGALPYLNFPGIDLFFAFFKSHWVPFYLPNSILLTPCFCRKNQFVSITFSSRDKVGNVFHHHLSFDHFEAFYINFLLYFRFSFIVLRSCWFLIFQNPIGSIFFIVLRTLPPRIWWSTPSPSSPSFTGGGGHLPVHVTELYSWPVLYWDIPIRSAHSGCHMSTAGVIYNQRLGLWPITSKLPKKWSNAIKGVSPQVPGSQALFDLLSHNEAAKKLAKIGFLWLLVINVPLHILA